MTAATTPGRDPSRRFDFNRGLLYLIAIVVLLVIIVPLSFSVIGGFRSNAQLAADPVGLPDPWVWTNYQRALTDPSFYEWVKNSVLIALITTALVLPAASLAAFVIARYRFRGRELVFALFTLGLLFPVAVAILPLFITLRQTGLLNNPLGIALPQAAFGLPLSIVILRPFFRSIPRDLEDAAAIDGCGPFRFYWSVMLPLSRPVLSTIAVLTIVGSWNAFLLPLLILIDPGQWTLPLGINNISAQYVTDTAAILAYTTLAMIPALIFYFIAQRQIVSGLTAGGVKG
ncbi:MAG TPA: carbohydrate ABC transporter permease [Acidimicrobiia bacterium]|nr:carbohydrate ABC transporter permease [Acidimicrobiia bacterium]